MQDTPSSPSFNSYSSSGKLAEIAARVAKEFSKEQDSDASGFNWDRDDEEEEDDELEFAFVCRDPNPFPIWADEIFHNGQIRPIYTDLLLSDSRTSNQTSIQLSLRKLMIQEREPVSDEFDGVPDGTYCVWRPKSAEAASPSPERCRKSNSAGSTSKIWKFRELLYRSNSDGKEGIGGKGRGEGIVGKEVQMVRKRSVVKEEEKRRSFLPHRPDLQVGFMANVNGLSRNLHPF